MKKEFLARLPHSLHTATLNREETHIGAICLDTRPSLILIEAYQHAQYLCRREYKRASKLLVNGVPAKDYLLGAGDMPTLEDKFPYVDINLYFVFFEVLNNALHSSLRKVGPNEQPPPIEASLISGTSMMTENERTVKITDRGIGIRRENVPRVWSYFFSRDSTWRHEPRGSDDEGDGHSENLPKAGRGVGLPVSRVLVRYFGGQIDLHSIPRKGTDVYIYL